MFKLLLAIYFIFIPFISLIAQNEYDKCYFGTAGIDFGSSVPTVLTDSQMEAVESAAAMCSANGDLLFYSNGGSSPSAPSTVGAIWNANHQIMENGILNDSNGCISSFEGAIAFPKFSYLNSKGTKNLNNSIYYIFMRDCIESSLYNPFYNSGLSYCEIDISANNGLGKVISKNNVAVPFNPNAGLSTSREPLTAILKGTNDGWYVFSYLSDSLYSIEVNNNLTGNFKHHVEGSGSIVFSPSIEHVVVGSKLYNYDMINNELSFNIELPENMYAFSPNGKLLYGLGGGKLVQYNMENSDIKDGKIIITSGVTASNIYLAPDGRIYLFDYSSNYLPGYIDCPNKTGVNCGLYMNSIYLGGKQSGYAFTNIPANFLYKEGINCTASLPVNKHENFSFDISPNPSDGKFIVEIKGFNNKPKPFEIISLVGNVVFKGFITDEKESVNLSFLKPGVYFVDVGGTKKKIILK